MVHSAEDGSIPVPDMSALIARLEAAEAWCRELDAAIADELDPIENQHDGYPGRWPFAEGSPLILRTPAVTTSLDAALALAERVLPEWRVFGVSDERGFQVNAGWGAGICELRGPGIQHARSPTPALALCIAILKPRHRERDDEPHSPSHP